MLRVSFLIEWIARFFHLGVALRVQNEIRGLISQTEIRGSSIFVHMCAYNGLETLEHAVMSMVAQEHKNWCLFISDDASTDGTWELIQELSKSDTRIVVARMPENLYLNGKSHRNVGLQRFREGEWDFYTVLDQDDVAEPHWLRKCMQIDWRGISVLRMWNARYDSSLTTKKYEYPAAAQVMVPRSELQGIDYRRGTGVPVDTDFLYRMEFRAVKKFKAIVVSPFLCQRMRFSDTNQTANPEAVTIGRWGFFWKYFWSA